MCGRSGVEMADFELDGYFGEVGITHRDLPWLPGADFWPGYDVLVARPNTHGELKAERARWGLVPPWWASIDGPGGDRKPYPTHIARVESAATTATWRDAWAGRPGAGRCLVIATHWYEWTGPKGAKEAVRFTVPGHRAFAVAGLWSDFGGQLTAAMVTCAAAEDIAWAHDRMPLILHPSVWSAWLAGQDGQVGLGPPPVGVVDGRVVGR